jgi:hypothetical protein
MMLYTGEVVEASTTLSKSLSRFPIDEKSEVSVEMLLRY